MGNNQNIVRYSRSIGLAVVSLNIFVLGCLASLFMMDSRGTTALIFLISGGVASMCSFFLPRLYNSGADASTMSRKTQGVMLDESGRQVQLSLNLKKLEQGSTSDIVDDSGAWQHVYSFISFLKQNLSSLRVISDTISDEILQEETQKKSVLEQVPLLEKDASVMMDILTQQQNQLATVLSTVTESATAAVDQFSLAEETKGLILDAEDASQSIEADIAKQIEGISGNKQSVNTMKDHIQIIEKDTNKIHEFTANAQYIALEGGSNVSAINKNMRLIQRTVDESSRLVEELSQGSEQIEDIIGVIEDIAEQTQLLAINASIEAVKAGEYGRGFSIIAGYVNRLASESNRATTQITDIIKHTQHIIEKTVTLLHEVDHRASEGSSLTEDAKTTMDEIIISSESVVGQLQGIAQSIGVISHEGADLTVAVDKALDNANEIADKSNQIKSITHDFTNAFSDLFLLNKKNSTQSKRVLQEITDLESQGVKVFSKAQSSKEIISKLSQRSKVRSKRDGVNGTSVEQLRGIINGVTGKTKKGFSLGTMSD
jgi:methyl-accepting chemotaxis protein